MNNFAPLPKGETGMRFRVLAAVAAFGVTATALAQSSTSPEAAIKAGRSRLGTGYLKPADWPDSLTLLPKPPAEGSRAIKRDQRLQTRALAQHGKPRWDIATSDADLFSPKASGAMSCAAKFEVSPTATPAIDKILRGTMAEFGGSTAKAKNHYKRPRPFMVNNQPLCTPDWEKILRGDGSYPSGHAAIGYGWGMIMAEIVPARKVQLLKRGKAFAESRRYCNVHWQSDVEAGIAVAKVVMGKLRADPKFQADLAAAKAEAKAATLPASNCAAEKRALATR